MMRFLDQRRAEFTLPIVSSFNIRKTFLIWIIIVLRRREFYNRIVIITTTTLYQHRSRRSYCVQYSTNPTDPTTPLRPQSAGQRFTGRGANSYAAAQSKNVLGDALAGQIYTRWSRRERTTGIEERPRWSKRHRETSTKNFTSQPFIRKRFGSFGIIRSPRTRICNVSGCWAIPTMYRKWWRRTKVQRKSPNLLNTWK